MFVTYTVRLNYLWLQGGKLQMGNLLPAALKGMFMQRLGADSELATCFARMVDLNGS